MILGEALRFYREKVGISARELSKAAGLSSSYVSKVENAIITPSIEAFSDIVVHLGMNEREIGYLVLMIYLENKGERNAED